MNRLLTLARDFKRFRTRGGTEVRRIAGNRCTPVHRQRDCYGFAMNGFGRLDVEKWMGKNVMVTNASESFLGRLSSCGELGLALVPEGLPDQIWLFPWTAIQRVDLVFTDGMAAEFP